MIHLYCGDGKGKTTAAAGLAVRAAGQGMKVLFAQLLKAGESGEITVLSKLDNVEVKRAGGSEKFTFQMTSEEKSAEAEKNHNLMLYISEKAASDDFDMIIIDEAVTAVEKGILDEEQLKIFVENFNPVKELVLTGSVPELWMIEAADYVTDMEKIKHPFDKGVPARKGVEY